MATHRTGAMNKFDIASLDLSQMVWLKGPAGSVTVHNCCMVHGSLRNHAGRPRPLLLQTYSALDSYRVLGIGANGVDGPNSGAIVGGDRGPDHARRPGLAQARPAHDLRFATPTQDLAPTVAHWCQPGACA